MMALDPFVLMPVFFFIAGAIIGSFLNVCIVRLPQNASVVFPSSHCPACKAPIAWFDNIPLISFLVLKAKCRACKEKIAWRYFVVELLTACIFTFSYFWMGLSLALVPALVLMCCLIVASWVDLEWRIIPDEISVGGMWAGLALAMFIPGLHGAADADVLGIGSVVSFIMAAACALLYSVKILYKKLPFEKEDRDVFLLGAAFLVLQWAAQVLARFLPSYDAPLSALADALQGVIIGGCSLWVTGLIGEILITKRVVTVFDFKGMVDDPAGLMKVLCQAGYVDDRGNLQACFRDVKDVAALKLSGAFEDQRKDIFEMLQAVDEGGVMGWGDVKLLAMAGAFLGWQLAVAAFFIAPFFGAAVGVVKILRRQDTAIAYGPFLAIGIVISLYGGSALIRRLLMLYGVN